MTTNALSKDILDTIAKLDDLEALLSDEPHEAPVVRVEVIAAEIRALARSGHVTACSGLPITQRVQSSGRAEPELAGAGDRGLRALAKLGRLYAHGGDARRAAVALWWTYSGEKALAGDAHHLTLALVLLLEAPQRLAVALSWEHWGRGSSARALIRRGRNLLELAHRLYHACSDEPGSSGVFGELLAALDDARSAARLLKRAAETERERLRDLARYGMPQLVRSACVNDRNERVTRCDRMRGAEVCVELEPRMSEPCAPVRRSARRFRKLSGPTTRA